MKCEDGERCRRGGERGEARGRERMREGVR